MIVSIEEENMDDECTVSWEDATEWEVSRSQDAGCFDARGGSPILARVLTARSPRRPAPAAQTWRTWGTLETEVGGPISGGARDSPEARCRPRPGGACQDRPVGPAFGTARLQPATESIDPLPLTRPPRTNAERRPPEGPVWHAWLEAPRRRQKPDRRS